VSSLRTFIVENDGGARPDGGDGIIGAKGGTCPGTRKDLVASELEEDWCSSCTKKEQSNKPKNVASGNRCRCTGKHTRASGKRATPVDNEGDVPRRKVVPPMTREQAVCGQQPLMEVGGRCLSRMVVASAVRVLLSVEEPPIGVGRNSSVQRGGKTNLLEGTRHGAEPVPPKMRQSIVRGGSSVGTIGIWAGRRPPMKAEGR
jgi:hypothetical protein